jgi:aspartyl-tRNA(Asn)/glutamyl-tRNA(Gln) amidotransferase subunit B
VEVKNMNSFRAVYRALEYEEKRQREVMDTGGKIAQETRGWLDDKNITVSQRSKEYAHDYRYFPEPDLPPLSFSRETVEQMRAALPELPEAKFDRFVASYGITPCDAEILTDSQPLANYFEECVKLATGNEGEGDTPKKARAISNWILGDFSRLLNLENMQISDSKVKPHDLVELLDLMQKGALSGPLAKKAFEVTFKTGVGLSTVIQEQGLIQISDSAELAIIIDKVIRDNDKAVADYRAGKETSLTFLIGQVMKASRGKANPAVVRPIIVDKLGGN